MLYHQLIIKENYLMISPPTKLITLFNRFSTITSPKHIAALGAKISTGDSIVNHMMNTHSLNTLCSTMLFNAFPVACFLPIQYKQKLLLLKMVFLIGKKSTRSLRSIAIPIMLTNRAWNCGKVSTKEPYVISCPVNVLYTSWE